MSENRKKRPSSVPKKLSAGAIAPAKSAALSIESRIEALEQRIAELEGRVNNLTIPMGPLYGVGFGEPPISPPATGRHPGGAPRRVEDAILYGTRDRLVDFLEPVWPEISRSLLKANTAEEIRKAFEIVPGSGEYERELLLEHADVLLEFLESSEFVRKPSRASVEHAIEGRWNDPKKDRAAARLPTRQIANAMAGVPKLAWRSSLKRCRATPCPMAVQARTGEHFRKLYKIPFSKLVWKRAAEGDPPSQYQVGMAYAHGIGVAQDYAKAAEWWQRAAKGGEHRAWFELAESYDLGRGVEWDPVSALAWYLATPAGTRIGQWARLRRLLETMSPEEIAHSHAIRKKILAEK